MTQLNRRDFLVAIGLAGTAVSLASCGMGGQSSSSSSQGPVEPEAS